MYSRSTSETAAEDPVTILRGEPQRNLQPAMSADGSQPPVPPSDQMRVSGSGRRKVALPPGRSLLDWMRNSANIAMRRRRSVTMEEVATHKARGDAWLVVRGIVYDVSPYVEYHPGGIPMILSRAGKVCMFSKCKVRQCDHLKKPHTMLFLRMCLRDAIIAERMLRNNSKSTTIG